MRILISYFYFLDFWLLKVTHIWAGRLIHKRSILTIRFRKPNLIRNVWINSLICCCLCCKRRIILLHNLSLLSYSSLFLISLFISDHFQIFYFCFGGWGKAFFHSLFSSFICRLELFSFILIFYNICLAHRKLWNSSLHLSC